MALFDDERLSRPTISVTREQRRRLGELARRAGSGTTMVRDARPALDVGLDHVSEAMDRERTAIATDGAGAERAPKQSASSVSAWRRWPCWCRCR